MIVGGARAGFDADHPEQLRAHAAALGFEHVVRVPRRGTRSLGGVHGVVVDPTDTPAPAALVQLARDWLHAEFVRREAAQRVGFDRARIHVVPHAASRRLS